MAGQDQRDEAFMKGLFEAYIERARGLSTYMIPGAGGRKLSPDEIRTAWNERAMPIEQEWDLWRIGRTPESIARGERALSPEEIGLRVFPHRERIAKGGGRVQPKEWIAWVNQYAGIQQRKADAGQPALEGMTNDASMVSDGE